MVSWDYYDKFDGINDRYLPDRGEGDNAATQAVTAVNKLVYKWYNDGDVFDNNYSLQGWANDLSSYANWLSEYVDGCRDILDEIKHITSEGEYEELLKNLADLVMTEKMLDVLKEQYNNQIIGTIYDCEGDYSYTIEEDDEEEDDYYDDYEDEDEEEYDDDDDEE